MNILTEISEHWVIFSAIGTALTGIAIWFRYGRSADRIKRNENRVKADNVLIDQVDRLIAKVISLQNDRDKYIDTISTLRRECPDCVGKILKILENKE